ncbi:YggT family protein [Mycoplasmatota bacterium zrk1]
MELVIRFIIYFLVVYRYLILAYVIMSWFPNFVGNPFHKFLFTVCEPYIQKFRRIIPPIAGLDFSPIVGFLLLNFAISGLASIQIA